MTEPALTYRMDPCGECVEGTCDGCEFCQWFAALPGAKAHEATWIGLNPSGSDEFGSDVGSEPPSNPVPHAR